MTITLINPGELLQPPSRPRLEVVERGLVDIDPLTSHILDEAVAKGIDHQLAVRAALDMRTAARQLKLLQEDMEHGRETVIRTNHASRPLPEHLLHSSTQEDKVTTEEDARAHATHY